MLKVISAILAIAINVSIYANCEISELIQNKSCSSEYFTARNLKQLNEYLQYGKFKDGKLLNLEIGFDIRDKEINIGTTCDLKLKYDADLRANLNGICLQANNIYIRKQSTLFSDKKAPISLIAKNSIKIRKTRIQTSGEINILTKSFEPFLNEILISKDSHLSAEKININTPSSLIINENSKIRSSNIILNGGNCEIGDDDNQENDENRDNERQCRKFKPNFSFTGSCLNNPIPTALKISSIPDKSDSLKIRYSVSNTPVNASVFWKFNKEYEASGDNVLQNYLLPGRHLAEAVVSNPSGYFRRVGSYNNVSPTKLNKGQSVLFEFHGLKNAPERVMGISGIKMFTLKRTAHDQPYYIGDIPIDTAGIKLISIPALKYKGSFNYVVLPEISNPDVYINHSVDQLIELLNSINSTNQLHQNARINLQNLLSEFKKKFETISNQEKKKIAEYLQANLFGDLQGITSFKQMNSRPSSLLSLLITSSYAADDDSSIFKDMLKITSKLNAKAFTGAAAIALGGFLLIKNSKTSVDVLIAALATVGAIAYLLTEVVNAQEVIGNVHTVDQGTLYLKHPNIISTGTSSNFSIIGQAIPLDSTAPTSALISQSLDAKSNVNLNINKINSNIDALNENMSILGISTKVELLPLISFPQTRFPTSIDTKYITKIELINSEDGQASIQSVTKNASNFSIVFNSLKTQKAILRVTVINNDFGINKNIDTEIVITAAPKAVINYTKNNLQVNFDSIDPQNPNVTGLTYFWNFGDGQSTNTTSKTVSHNYAQAGTYTVKLNIEDELGNITSAEKNLTLNASSDAIPRAIITSNESIIDVVAEPGKYISLSAESSLGDEDNPESNNEIVYYSWKYTSMNVSTFENQEIYDSMYVFKISEGESVKNLEILVDNFYQQYVTLKVTNKNGISKETSIVIHPKYSKPELQPFYKIENCSKNSNGTYWVRVNLYFKNVGIHHYIKPTVDSGWQSSILPSPKMEYSTMLIFYDLKGGSESTIYGKYGNNEFEIGKISINTGAECEN